MPEMMPTPKPGDPISAEQLAAVEEILVQMANMILLSGHMIPMLHEPGCEEYQDGVSIMSSAEKAMQEIGRLFMPEKHAQAMRLKQQLLNRMRPDAN